MIEGPNLEAEIADLTKQIDAKRNQLQEERGIVPESKEVVKEVLSEHIYAGGQPSATATDDDAVSATTTTDDDDDSYLDSMPPEAVEKVNGLIEMIGTEGIKKTIELAKEGDPYVLDAFHDALVDKLHGDLKSAGVI